MSTPLRTISLVSMSPFHRAKDIAPETSTTFFEEFTESSLGDYFRSNKSNVFYFLCFVGLLSPSKTFSSVESISCGFWTGFIFLFLLSWEVYTILDWSTGIGKDGRINAMNGTVCAAQLMIFISVCQCYYFILIRLNKKCLLREAQEYTHLLKYNRIFISSSVVFSILYAMIPPKNANSSRYADFRLIHFGVNTVGEILISVLMSACLLFTIIDMHISYIIIDNLLNVTERHQLTQVRLKQARNEIHMRVQTFQIPTTVMLIMAFIGSVGLFVKIFFMGSDEGIGAIFSAFSIFFSEIMFLVITSFAAAYVNQKSDSLVKLLGVSDWGEEEVGLDNLRMKLHTNASSDPLSFRLLGMRIKIQDMQVRLAGLVFTGIVGVVRAAVTSYQAS